MENQFDLGLNIASIETELPDPVITLSGSDVLTASGTAEMPLINLTAYGRSWQDERIVNIADMGIEGYGIPVLTGSGNYTDSNGQQWVCDELIVDADGTGRIVKRLYTYAFTGDETFGYYDNNGIMGLPFAPLGIPGVKIQEISSGSNLMTAFFSHGIVGTQGQVFRGEAHIASSEWNNTYLYFSVPIFGTTEELKALMRTEAANGTPLTLVYELAAPAETELTAEQIAALQPLIDKYGTFTVYFMSTQDGTPTPENPVEIVSTADLHRVSVSIESVGDSGSLTVTTQDNAAINIADVGIEGYGIPVDSGGNYTDSNGQQWVCDELVVHADGTGKIIKNISSNTFDGENKLSFAAYDTGYSDKKRFAFKLNPIPKELKNSSCIVTLSNKYPAVSANDTYWAKTGIGIQGGYNEDGLCYIYDDERYTMTFREYNEWLKSNPVTVFYPLAVSAEIKLTAEQIAVLQPLIDKYGAFTAYFMSTQDGTPTPENPVEIVSTADLYQFATAIITTSLPLRGIPVSNDGNYIDSNGQDWICDTLEHVYGEPAQVVRRIKNASVRALYEMKEGSTAYIKDHSGNGHNLYTWIKDAEFVWRDDISDPCWYLNGTGVWQKYARDELGEYVLLWDEAWTDSYFNEYGASIRIVAGTWTVRQITYKGLPLPDPLPALPVTVPAFSLSTGDPVPSVYISDVGGISDGAEIIYPSEAEEIILTTHETEQLNELSGYEGSTTVYNENTAEMTVKLLREDYEMQYIHWIKESQSFVCEKTGKYKIICVGGGSSGGIGVRGASDTLQAVGTTTSFGNIISASGGGRTKPAADESFNSHDIVGGQSGYDGINYGSTSYVMSKITGTIAGDKSSVMWGTGHGYGAGGGAKGCKASYTTADGGGSSDFLAAGGQCGKVESTIVDLEENQTVFCTVGGGGVLNLSDQNVADYLKIHVTDTATGATVTGAALSACVTDGADGVIIIQYLGL